MMPTIPPRLARPMSTGPAAITGLRMPYGGVAAGMNACATSRVICPHDPMAEAWSTVHSAWFGPRP